MPNPATLDADGADTGPLQNLALRAERNWLDHAVLVVFANAVDVLLDRGLAYTLGLNEGRDQLELMCDLGRPLRRLERMAGLAAAYGTWDHEELEHAAILAACRQTVRMRTFVAGAESESRLLKTLGPSGAFARCLLAWRKLRAAGDLPPPEFVAYYVAFDWGEYIDKHTLPEIACHLAAAFDDSQLTVAQAEALVAAHGMQVLTPELAHELAVEAISRARDGHKSAAS